MTHRFRFVSHPEKAQRLFAGARGCISLPRSLIPQALFRGFRPLDPTRENYLPSSLRKKACEIVRSPTLRCELVVNDHRARIPDVYVMYPLSETFR